MIDRFYIYYDTFSKAKVDEEAKGEDFRSSFFIHWVVSFRFDRLEGADEKFVIMALEERDKEQHEDLLSRRLREKLGIGCEEGKDSDGCLLPPWSPFIVQVRSGVNDIELPGLKLDEKKKELSFEWRDMFSRFLGEEKAGAAVLAKKVRLSNSHSYVH